MPRELTPTQSTGTLTPDVPGRSRVIRNPGQSDIPDKLAQLSQTLDPFGTGPLAQYFHTQRQKALETVAAEFQRDAMVDEAMVIQRNPSLRGYGFLVESRLDELRGERSAARAADRARIEAAQLELEGSSPEKIEAFYQRIQDETLAQGKFGAHGQRAFLAKFGDVRSRAMIDATDEHVEKINEQHVASAGETARAEISSRAASGDWSDYGRTWLDWATTEEGLRGPDSRKDLISATIAGLEESVARNPETGPDGFRAILDARVPELQPDGSIKDVNYVSDPKMREAIADAAIRAAATRQEASESTAKARKAAAEAALLDEKAAIAKDISDGKSAAEAVARSEARIADEKFNPDARFDAYQALRKIRPVVNETQAMDAGEHAALKVKIVRGQVSFDYINSTPMSDAQRKEATDLALRVAQQPTLLPRIEKEMNRLDDLKVRSPVNAQVYVERNALVEQQKSQFRSTVMEVIAENPELLDATAEAQIKLTNLMSDLQEEIRKSVERQYPADPLKISGALEPGSVEKEQAVADERAGWVRAINRAREDTKESIAAQRINDMRTHERAAALGYIEASPDTKQQEAILHPEPSQDPQVNELLKMFDEAVPTE